MTTRSRADLIAENAMLQQQLIVLNRQVKRPQLTTGDRVRLVLLARCTQFWQQALHIVQPDTLLHWHRDLFRRYWWRKSQKKKRKPRIAQEIVRGEFLDRVHIGLDFFDASINRVAAWVIGTRNALRALLMALLEPLHRMRELEVVGDYSARLALLEELKGMPFGAVWDYYCMTRSVPVGMGFVDEIRAYEQQVLSHRD